MTVPLAAPTVSQKNRAPNDRRHPDGGALQFYANDLPEPDRSVFSEDLKRWLLAETRGEVQVEIEIKRR